MKIVASAKKIMTNRDFLIVLYKVSYDALFYLAVSMVISLLLEAVMPGMISGHYGFIILTFLILTIITITSWLGSKLEISFKKKRYNALPFALFFAFILSGNALLKFTLAENLIITTVTTVIIILLYQILLSEKE